MPPSSKKTEKKSSVFALYNVIVLFAYNLTQFIGWIFVLLKVFNLFFFKWDNSVDFLKASYRDTGFFVLMLQQLAQMELVLAAVLCGIDVVV